MRDSSSSQISTLIPGRVNNTHTHTNTCSGTYQSNVFHHPTLSSQKVLLYYAVFTTPFYINRILDNSQELHIIFFSNRLSLSRSTAVLFCNNPFNTRYQTFVFTPSSMNLTGVCSSVPVKTNLNPHTPPFFHSFADDIKNNNVFIFFYTPSFIFFIFLSKGISFSFNHLHAHFMIYLDVRSVGFVIIWRITTALKRI